MNGAPTAEWFLAKRELPFKVRPRAADIFRGQSRVERTTIDGASVLRLTVIPEPFDAVPQSFAVSGNFDWKKIDAALPLHIEWQHSVDGRFDVQFPINTETKCFGLGERYSPLNLRGARHSLVSADNPNHTESIDAMYKAVPFGIFLESGKAFGLFLDSPAPQNWDLDSERDSLVRVELYSRRPWQLYIIETTTLPNLVAIYTSLTGRHELPPRWALGHQQSRWSYPDQATVKEIAHEFRSRKIPCDTIVLDIDYMDGYRVFTHSRERFPDFQKMITDLRKDNFRIVTIIDPGVKQDENYELYLEGKEKDLFAKKFDGSLFIETVWPGLSAFPDFLKAETRSWWGEHLKFYEQSGVSGIWNDMNEPAFFGAKDPLPSRIDNLPTVENQYFMQQAPDGPVGHLEVRNLYGTLMNKATHEALLKMRPNERPFVLTRSAGPGIQRYAAVWLGDNMSWFEHMRNSIPMLLNVGLSGMGFCGIDIGGYGGNAGPELMVRWYEVGIFYPFFRNHCELNRRAQEAFAYSEEVETKIRHLIETHYKMLPYIESLFWEQKRTGAPLMRPLFWHYPEDQVTLELNDQFMFGSQIVVAPVTYRGQTHRNVYLPEGRWYPLSGGPALEGGKFHWLEMKLGTVPAFVREGAILPFAEVIQSTAEYPQATVTFNIYGDTADGVFFEEDGTSFDFAEGRYNEWKLNWKNGSLTSEAIHSGYAAPPRSYRLRHEQLEQAFHLKQSAP
jgi:alpha-glucosidase